MAKDNRSGENLRRDEAAMEVLRESCGEKKVKEGWKVERKRAGRTKGAGRTKRVIRALGFRTALGVSPSGFTTHLCEVRLR